MSEQNQIGEISVGVTANTGALEAGLQQAEMKVAESAAQMAASQAQAAKQIEIVHTEASLKIQAAQQAWLSKQATMQDEAMNTLWGVPKAATASAEATTEAFSKQEEAGKGLIETMRGARQGVERFTQAIGLIGAVIGVWTTFYTLGKGIRELFRDGADDARNFMDSIAGDDVRTRLSKVDDQLSLLQSRLGKGFSDYWNSEGFGFAKRVTKEIEVLERERNILIARMRKAEFEEQKKAQEAASLAEAKAVTETLRQINQMRADARRESMTEEERIVDETNQKIEQMEMELFRFRAVGRVEEAQMVEDAIVDIREAGLRKLAELQKKQDDERRKAAEEEAEQYQKEMFEKIAMQVELAEAQRKAAEEYAKQFEASAQKIQDALTNAFNASASASQQLSRQVTSDISQIIPLLQQLIRNQRR